MSETVVCPRCNEEWKLYNPRMKQLYSRGCPECASKYAKLVFQCRLCGAIHWQMFYLFHQSKYCSKCPGLIEQRYVWSDFGRLQAWNDASKLPNQGDW